MTRYNDIVMEHFTDPRNRGVMDRPEAVGVAHLRSANGPFVQLFLQINQQIVELAMFQARGCGFTIAAMSVLTEMVEEQTIEACRLITQHDIDHKLGGLPREKAFCAGLAHLALQNALDQQSIRSQDQGLRE